MLDHLVYAVPDLAAAVADFTARGYPPSPGGRHRERGTHNALLRLGPRNYLELLAVDPDTAVPPPRWMGVDLIAEAQLTRWARSAGATITREAGLLNAVVQAGSRELGDGRTLRWRLTDPGSSPAVAVVPFLIDWGGPDAPHPTDDLPDLGLRLTALRLTHPDPPAVTAVLRALGEEPAVYAGPRPALHATLSGPRGTIEL